MIDRVAWQLVRIIIIIIIIVVIIVKNGKIIVTLHVKNVTGHLT